MFNDLIERFSRPFRGDGCPPACKGQFRAYEDALVRDSRKIRDLEARLATLSGLAEAIRHCERFNDEQLAEADRKLAAFDARVQGLEESAINPSGRAEIADTFRYVADILDPAGAAPLPADPATDDDFDLVDEGEATEDEVDDEEAFEAFLKDAEPEPTYSVWSVGFKIGGPGLTYIEAMATRDTFKDSDIFDSVEVVADGLAEADSPVVAENPRPNPIFDDLAGKLVSAPFGFGPFEFVQSRLAHDDEPGKLVSSPDIYPFTFIPYPEPAADPEATSTFKVHPAFMDPSEPYPA